VILMPIPIDDRDKEYEEVNQLLRYTMAERFQHLGLFLSLSTGSIAAFFWKSDNIALRCGLAFFGCVYTLALWVMQWRAIWRQHILMHIAQEIENDSQKLWGQLTSRPRPLWLKRIGDSEITVFLFLLAFIGWLYLLLFSFCQIFSIDTDCFFVNLIIGGVALLTGFVLQKSLRLPPRAKRHLDQDNKK